MNAPVLNQFLRQIGRRIRVVNFARRARGILTITFGIFALALLVSRFNGVLTAWFSPVSLVVFLLVGFLLAWIFHVRPHQTDAARLADSHLGTSDLFLTATQIEQSLGGYQELVLREAAQRSGEVSPQIIAPYRWKKDALRFGGMLAVLLAGIFFLPEFDPWGIHKNQKQLAEQREHVRELAKASTARAELLEQKHAGEQTDVVKQALANLEKTFQQAKPNDKAGTLAKLTEQQKIFNQLWKQASEEKLKNGLNLPPSAQNFGLADPAKAQQLRNDLQKGDVSSASKELDELKKKAEALAAAKNPVEREKLRQELMDRLQNLKDTLNQQANSQALNSDLQRALEQLAIANTPELAGEALKGVADSLKLSQEELQQLAQTMADMKNLEEALKALQLAKALHNLSPLDGEACTNCNSLADYEALFQSMCDSQCAGGIGNHGGGGGMARVGSDESTQTDFKSEKSASQLQPGRILMEWKTREVSEAGPAREEYLRAVSDIRQQASEAVVSEQIPPGYQAAIKNYFDTLHNDSGAKSQP